MSLATNQRQMKITINTSTASFDPAATCTDEQLADSVAAYGREIKLALTAAFPGAEIEHNVRPDDVTYGHEITGIDAESYDDAMREVQEILEGVYGAGNFWA